MIDPHLRAVVLSCVLLSMCACSASLESNNSSTLDGDEPGPTVTLIRIGPNAADPQRAVLPSIPKEAAGFTFKPPRQYKRLSPRGTMAIYEALHAADFNGDGRMDLVAMPSQNQIDLFVQQADGTLAPPLIYTYGGDSGTLSTNMVSNDFNGDGLMDIAFGRVPAGTNPGGISVLLSTGEGPLVYRVGYFDYSGTSHAYTASLDVDGDGHQDLVAAHNEYTAYIQGDECGTGRDTCPRYTVLHGDGQGNFGRKTLFKLGLPLEIRELDVQDLNEDGRPDLVMTLIGTQGYAADYPGEVRVAYSKPEGGLTTSVFVHPGYIFFGGYLVFGDLNGDGTDDSVMTYGSQRHRMQVRMRSLDGGFDPPLALYHDNLHPGLPLLADFDGNGRTDLVNHQFGDFGTTAYIALYLQSGGTLQAPIHFRDPPLDFGMKVSGHSLGYASGDFNGDGCTDLAIAALDDGVLIMDGSNCLPKVRLMSDDTMFRRGAG